MISKKLGDLVANGFQKELRRKIFHSGLMLHHKSRYGRVVLSGRLWRVNYVDEKISLFDSDHGDGSIIFVAPAVGGDIRSEVLLEVRKYGGGFI